MRHKQAKICALAAFALGLTTVTAEAANCQGRRDTGTAVGAIGGGLLGNGVTRGSAGGTIAGAVIGGVAGNVIGGEKFAVQRKVREVEFRQTALLGAEKLAWPAQAQILFGDDKSIIGGPQRGEALFGSRAQRSVIDQQAGRTRRSPPHASAQLMQLGEA